MSWKHHWPAKKPRPKARKLDSGESDRILAVLRSGIQSSPVLTGLGIQARFLRGRFYLERVWQDSEPPDVETIGRVTPLAEQHDLLLEAGKGKSAWYEVKRGTAEEIINAVAADTKGTFHGLGALDASLRGAGGSRLEVRMQDNLAFVYVGTGQACTVQEALFHYFGVPIAVIAEPREWYVYHRRPRIVEASEDRTRAMVRFTAMSASGSTFGGTCLYAVVNNVWHAFTIRPNQSQDISTAIAWLEKRDWRAW